MGAHLTMDVRSDANLSPSCIFPNCQKKRTKVKAILKISEWNSKAWGGGMYYREKRHQFSNQTNPNQTSCVTSGKSLELSELPFPHL